MTTVVKSSSSVYSTYISTVDHLPCDIVRSLWLVQACNIAADTETQKLHQFLKQYPYNEIHQQQNRQEIARVYRESQEKILRWNREALAELENLDLSMKSHELLLRRGVESLHLEAQKSPATDQRAKSELLKSQLDQHYRENPLTSQVEALQERVLKGSRNVIIKHIPGRSSGVKIILKLPKKHKGDTNQKPNVRSQNIRGRGSMGTRSEYLDPSRLVEKKKSNNGSTSLELSKKRGRPRKLQFDAAYAVNLETKPAKVSPVPVLQSESPLIQSEEPDTYCFCHQPSSGDMIACDNKKCPNGEWFHYKCVGLLRADAQKYKKWYCTKTCKEKAESEKPRKKKRRNKW